MKQQPFNLSYLAYDKPAQFVQGAAFYRFLLIVLANPRSGLRLKERLAKSERL